MKRRSKGTGTVEQRRIEGVVRFYPRLRSPGLTLGQSYGTYQEAEAALETTIGELKSKGLFYDGLVCEIPANWPKHGGVYACTSPSLWPLVKVGRSADLSKRLADLAREFNPLGLLAILSENDAEEALFHRRFHKEHVHGEWFKFRGALRATVLAARKRALAIDGDAACPHCGGAGRVPKSPLDPPRTG